MLIRIIIYSWFFLLMETHYDYDQLCNLRLTRETPPKNGTRLSLPARWSFSYLVINIFSFSLVVRTNHLCEQQG